MSAWWCCQAKPEKLTGTFGNLVQISDKSRRRSTARPLFVVSSPKQSRGNLSPRNRCRRWKFQGRVSTMRTPTQRSLILVHGFIAEHCGWRGLVRWLLSNAKSSNNCWRQQCCQNTHLFWICHPGKCYMKLFLTPVVSRHWNSWKKPLAMQITSGKTTSCPLATTWKCDLPTDFACRLLGWQKPSIYQMTSISCPYRMSPGPN